MDLSIEDKQAILKEMAAHKRLKLDWPLPKGFDADHEIELVVSQLRGNMNMALERAIVAAKNAELVARDGLEEEAERRTKYAKAEMEHWNRYRIRILAIETGYRGITYGVSDAS